MDWARIMAPLSGGDGDRRALAAAALVARLFDAEVLGAYAPADVSDLIPWMGDGYMGGVQPSALDSLRDASAAGAAAARLTLGNLAYENKRFVGLCSPVWAGLAMEARLSDLVVFDDAPARGRGALAESFQQIVAGEQRPTLVARAGLSALATIALAWDGGKEATRAVRTALPLLQKASRVVILTAPAASPRKSDPAALVGFLAARGARAEVEVIKEAGEAAGPLLKAAKAAGADLLVAGAFGHPRLQEFIFGGATRTFLNADAPSLFLSH
ncbi:MAG TPA: universal stress protein [Caulobacteraceae bacterium]|jgi:nucleotide-binding universal stress UspA family protein|nr:universal stress protein [Caulobacteraceae bacterium]